MRVLIIVIADSLEGARWIHNLKVLPGSLIVDQGPDDVIDIVACTSQSEELPSQIKWACGTRSIECPDQQFSKLCQVLATWEQHYDWHIKTRPDMLMNEPINLKSVSNGKINARARVYHGPLKLKYGDSLGYGILSYCREGSIRSQAELTELILDDQIYIFDDQIRKMGIFDSVVPFERQTEYFQTPLWVSRGAQLAVIGINCVLEKHGVQSGNLEGFP